MVSDNTKLTDKELAEVMENERRLKDMLFDQLLPSDFLNKTEKNK